MSKVARQLLLLLVVAVAAVPLAASSAGAQVAPDTTVTVRKVVTGTTTEPSSVEVTCTNVDSEDPPETLGVLSFDAEGNPTTVEPSDSPFTISDGAWVLTGNSNASSSCTFTETATGGATSTAWTCDYTSEAVTVPSAAAVGDPGCEAASGTGVGPATVVYPSNSEVQTQASTVVFTNTFTPAPTPEPEPEPAAAVVVQPAFTG